MGRIVLNEVEFKFEKVNDQLGETGVLNQNLFLNNDALTEVEMETIAVIEAGAFKRCFNLKKAIFPKCVLLGEEAFNWNRGLTDVILNEALTEIKNNTFEYCNNLKNINLSSNLEKVGDRAFDSCSILTIDTVLNNLKEIGDFGFSGCYNLDLKFDINKITKIGRGGFQNCNNLKLSTFPPNLEALEENQFQGCSLCTFDSISNRFKELPRFIFIHTGVAFKNLPFIKKFGEVCLGYCKNLTTLTLGSKGNPVEYITPHDFTGSNPSKWTSGSFYSSTNLISLTIYTTGGQPLAGAPWGATNATITYLPA